MILNFPLMHPELLAAAARAALPQDVRFLDPGLAAPGSAAHTRPERAPFDTRTAKALLADTLRYGEAVASPRDILAQGLVEQAGALNPESSRAVMAEVEQSVLGAVSPERVTADPLDEARKQAQLVLLLAWSLEERLIELRAAEEKIQTAFARLDKSVAAGEGEADDESDQEALSLGRELSGLELPVGADHALPWRKLLECCAALAPEARFATTEAEIGAILAEEGVTEGALDSMPGAQRVFSAPAWRFLGVDRLPEAKPWLAAPLTLGIFAPQGASGRGA
jgi:hypothetical protein